MEEVSDQASSEHLSRWVWRGDGWEIEFYPVAKLPEFRGTAGLRPTSEDVDSRGIAALVGNVEEPQTAQNLRESLRGKAGKYGQPGIPYVIAVNVVGWPVKGHHIMDALFGQASLTIDRISGESTRRRLANGFWVGHSGPVYRRVSAVLIVPDLTPCRIADATPSLWHNPWAEYPLRWNPFDVPERRLIIRASRLQRRPGHSAQELFGLPKGWPQSMSETSFRQ
jgi:hypothetical protein